MDTAIGDRPYPTHNPRIAPIDNNTFQQELNENPKVNIRPYKFDIE